MCNEGVTCIVDSVFIEGVPVLVFELPLRAHDAVEEARLPPKQGKSGCQDSATIASVIVTYKTFPTAPSPTITILIALPSIMKFV